MASGFEGRLGRQLLPDLLRDIAFKRLTGVLRLSHGKITRSIAFASGEPVNAFSNIPSEQLEARLIRDGRTTAGLVSAARRDHPDPALLGAALVEKGIVSAEVMQKTACELSTQIALSAFEWTEAEYCFDETEQLDWPHVIKVTLAELAIEGTRQAAASAAFVDLVAPPAQRVTRNQNAGNHLAASATLNSTEGYIFSLTASPARLSDIVTLSGLPAEQIRPAVCVLLALGMLTAVEETPQINTSGAQPAATRGSESGQPDDEVIRGISRKLRLFETASFYEILGVDKLATTAAINRAYEGLEAMFASHRAEYPNRADVQSQLDELFAKIKTAHHTLRDPLKRREYDRPSAAPRSSAAGDDFSSQHSTGKALRSPSLPKPVPIPFKFPPPAPLLASDPVKPTNAEPIIERGQAAAGRGSEAPLPPRRPIPIPELHTPVAPEGGRDAGVERGQWQGPRSYSTPPATPITPPLAVPITPPRDIRPDIGQPFANTASNEEQALHFYRQGRMRFERRELDAATHLFREAVRLDPTKSHHHFYLAVVLAIQSNARREHAHHEGCHVTCKLGGTLVSNPKVRYEAERHFLRAAQIDPSNVQITLGLAQLYKEAGLLKKADLYFKQVLMLDSKNEIARHELESLRDSFDESGLEDEELDVQLM